MIYLIISLLKSSYNNKEDSSLDIFLSDEVFNNNVSYSSFNAFLF